VRGQVVRQRRVTIRLEHQVARSTALWKTRFRRTSCGREPARAGQSGASTPARRAAPPSRPAPLGRPRAASPATSSTAFRRSHAAGTAP
jgi:hypothetical protein